jgi:hypothetical protein
MPAAPIAPPSSAVVENPKPAADDDDRFIARLLPKLTAAIDDRAGQQINRRLEQIAAEIEKADPENPHRSAGAVGSVIIAAAIAAFVKKVVMAVIATIVLSILVGLLWKYWLGALIVYAITGVIVPFVAGLIGGRLGR